MRSHEGNEAQVCYFIIQLLLLKPNDFRNRVSDFVKENSPEHWLQNDWHTKHMSYHKVSQLITFFYCSNFCGIDTSHHSQDRFINFWTYLISCNLFRLVRNNFEIIMQ